MSRIRRGKRPKASARPPQSCIQGNSCPCRHPASVATFQSWCRSNGTGIHRVAYFNFNTKTGNLSRHNAGVIHIAATFIATRANGRSPTSGVFSPASLANTIIASLSLPIATTYRGCQQSHTDSTVPLLPWMPNKPPEVHSGTLPQVHRREEHCDRIQTKAAGQGEEDCGSG